MMLQEGDRASPRRRPREEGREKVAPGLFSQHLLNEERFHLEL